jgi:SARP family transcriptional regulator, regulator of embCAB operon
VLRIYLAGQLGIELDGRFLGGGDLPLRQGRLAFAYLACERERAVTRHELAQAIWGDALAAAWDSGLTALISKLRSAFSRIGLDDRAVLTTTDGGYWMQLPPGSWVDLEVARRSLHNAESAAGAGSFNTAYGDAVVAATILRRPFLEGSDEPWVHSRRRILHAQRVRALDCLVDVLAWNDEPALALTHASEAIELEPYRERGYQRLMRLHSQLGDRAQALRVFERCRTLLSEELGVDPSPETMSVHRELLSSTSISIPKPK